MIAFYDMILMIVDGAGPFEKPAHCCFLCPPSSGAKIFSNSDKTGKICFSQMDKSYMLKIVLLIHLFCMFSETTIWGKVSKVRHQNQYD